MNRSLRSYSFIIIYLSTIACNSGTVEVPAMTEMAGTVDRTFQDFPDQTNNGGAYTGPDVNAGTTTGGTPMGGTPMGGTPMGGEPTGGEPMGGEPMGGEPTGGEPTGGEVAECDSNQEEPCVSCADDGMLITPDEDWSCPTIDCSSEELMINSDGDCVRTSYEEPYAPLCYDFGECEPIEDQFCEVREVEVIATGGPCQEVTSCEDGAEPEVAPKPNGALCYAWGTCQDGECSAAAACEQFTAYNQQNRYCTSEENDQGERTCTFLVYGTGLNDNGRTTCTEFCERSGAVCVDGWNNDNNNNCRRGGGDNGCDVSYESQVCVCGVP